MLWHRHQTAIVILLFLSTAAGLSNYFLGANLLPNGMNSNPDAAVSTTDDSRACTSVGTPFQDMTQLQEVMKFFRSQMSEVVSEREKFLSTPSKWQCLPDANGMTEPPMPKLEELAGMLPGWRLNYTLPIGGYPQKFSVENPLTFASFASVLAEFERAYKCKLSEFQDQTILIVTQGYDEDVPRQFCCQDNGCSFASPTSNCTTTPSDDRTCGGSCGPGSMGPGDFVERTGNYHAVQLLERKRAHLAVERTLSVLRSYEINYAYAKQLTCLQRASMDLKNEVGLLADAMSCMPRIWDSVTSIHDRKDE